MKNTKHTPGPWEVVKIKTSTGNYVYRKGSSVDHVATCGNPANAHLIAAAPELLEALKEAQKALLICKPIMAHYAEPQAAYAKVAQKIEQVIAKAEGK